MEITARGLWTLIHGMGFGALYLLACSGALVELYGFTSSSSPSEYTLGQQRFLKAYLLTMVFLAWAAVLTGAYVIYPWYRAVPPPGTTNLAMFPQRLLMSSPTTIGWHSLGMEWKEHIAWFAPISITMVAFVFFKYGRDLKNHKQLRAGVLAFVLASFVSAGVAGFFGAMLDKYAPVQGGDTIQLSNGEAK
jgi:magnesium-transporting ATPase (P-type)